MQIPLQLSYSRPTKDLSIVECFISSLYSTEWWLTELEAVAFAGEIFLQLKCKATQTDLGCAWSVIAGTARHS